MSCRSEFKEAMQDPKDLKETNKKMTIFNRESTDTLGFYIANLTIRSKTSNTVFFVVDAKHGYSLLFGRD